MILVLLREEPKETVNAVRGKPGLAFFTVVAIGQILPHRSKGKCLRELRNPFLLLGTF